MVKREQLMNVGMLQLGCGGVDAVAQRRTGVGPTFMSASIWAGHVEWSECQPKLEFVKIAPNGSHLDVSTSITYEASIGTEEAPKLRRGSRVRKQFVHRFQ